MQDSSALGKSEEQDLEASSKDRRLSKKKRLFPGLQASSMFMKIKGTGTKNRLRKVTKTD